jgi:ABC-type bacteriocin/lantibiotic exporter with double-glycine peptidase domain
MIYFKKAILPIKNSIILIENKIYKTILLIFLSTIIPVLEIANLTILLPIFEILLNHKNISEFSNFINKFLNFFNIDPNLKNLVLIFLFFFLIKILLNIFFYKIFHSFIEKIRADWCSKIHNNIIFSNNLYNEHKTFSEITNSILVETRKAQSAIKSFISLISSSVTFIITVLILFFISFDLTIIFLLIFIFILFLVGKKMMTFSSNVGDRRRVLDNFFMEKMNYVLQGFKQIKIFQIEEIVNKEFSIKIKDYAKIQAKLRFVSQAINPITELIVFLIFVIIIYYYLDIKNLTLEKIIPVIATVIVISNRLASNIKSLLSSALLLNGYNASLDSIKFYINKNKLKCDAIKNKKPINKFEDKLAFKNVSFAYGKKNVLKNFSLIVTKNDRVEIIGKSGSGKSTLVDLITGLKKPTSGSIFLDKKNIYNLNLKNILSYVPQEAFFFNDSLLNNILMQRTNYTKENVYEIINVCELREFVETKKNKLDFTISDNGANLSGGQRQRIGLVRALLSDPKILILDEATNSIDKITEDKIFFNILKKNPKICIISVTHRTKSFWSKKIVNLDGY